MEVRHKGNAFELEGKQDKAALLIHGLTSSTQEMEDLAYFLNSKGYHTYVPLLPGHNTNIKDLAKTKWEDWYSVVRENYMKASKHKEVVVIGLSMGGTLATYLAERLASGKNGDKGIDKLILLAPAIYFDNPMVKFSKIIKYFHPYSKKDHTKHYPHRKKATSDIASDEEFLRRISYKTASIAALAQAIELINKVKRNLSKVQIPTLIMHSINDHTIKHESSKYIHDRIRSKIKKLILMKKSAHIISCDVDKKVVFKQIFEFVK